MDSPITISSGSSPANKADYFQLHSRIQPSADKHGLLRDDSSESERALPNWDRRSKRHVRTDSNTTLTNMQKVADWIKSMEDNSRLYDVEGNMMCSPNLDQMKKQEPECNKNLILVRCDFNKSVTPPQTCYSPLNPFNCSAPLMKYFQKEKDVNNANTSSLQFQTLLEEVQKPKKLSPSSVFSKHSENETHFSHKSDFIRKMSLDKSSFCSSSKLINDEKSEESVDVYEVPLSAERRKRELCSYLKLMDPADKKQILILQNRRSTRVRNLAAMQERRQLDKEMKELENKMEKNQQDEKCPTMKSFKELNIKFPKPISDQDEELEKGNDENELFYFPFPPRYLINTVDDFDIVMKKIVPRFKRICNKKQIKFYSQDKIRNKISPKNKENSMHTKMNKSKSTKNKLNKTSLKLQEKQFLKLKTSKTNKNNNNIAGTHTTKLKNRNRSDRLKTLRSNGRIRNISRILENSIVKSGKKKKEVDVKQLTKIKRKEDQQQKKKEKDDSTNPHLDCDKTQSKTIPLESNLKGIIQDEISSGLKTLVHQEKKLNNFHCEILSIKSNPEDIDLENFIDDISDFNNLTEEHKRCLIESRIFSAKSLKNTTENVIIENELSEILINNSHKPNIDSSKKSQSSSPFQGFVSTDIKKINVYYETYQNLLMKYIHMCSESSKKSSKSSEDGLFEDKTDGMEQPDSTTNLEELPQSKESIETSLHCNGDATSDESNLEECPGSSESPVSDDNSEIDVVTVEETLPPKSRYTKVYAAEEAVSSVKESLCVNNKLELSPRSLPKKSDYEILPFNKSVEIKSLQKSLQFVKKKNNSVSIDSNLNQEWDTDESPKPKVKKQSHFICINKENGDVLRVFYVDFNLVVCQEFVVSFWMQTPLGNILGSQNMWIPRGHTQRILLHNKCVQKESKEMVFSTEANVAYIELWTKEHKSDIREGPVADIFVTLYFWKQRQNGLDKKVLQLENIKGFADDVQYCVMKTFSKIIVSWHSANGENISKKTFVHSYQLASDYQMISQVSDIEPVDHYVASLHNIEDCDNLIMGCGENKMTLWNLEHGYIIATIELNDIKTPLSTLWVKCDRGFLFAVQQSIDKELCLIAINGINHSWKKLASYFPSEGFDRLKGICIENGLLISYYEQGVLCWKAETGEPIEEITIETDLIPCGSYVILLEENQMSVRHATAHLLSLSMDDS